MPVRRKPNEVVVHAKQVGWAIVYKLVPWLCVVLLSGTTAAYAFYMSHTYMTQKELKETFLQTADYNRDVKANAEGLKTSIAELSAANERGRRETSQSLGEKIDGVAVMQASLVNELSKMRESQIRMEEKARIDEAQNTRLQEVERRLNETRDTLLRGSNQQSKLITVPRPQ